MRSPTDYFRGDMPYESYEEYLNELSVLMIVQLKQYLIEKKEYDNQIEISLESY